MKLNLLFGFLVALFMLSFPVDSICAEGGGEIQENRYLGDRWAFRLTGSFVDLKTDAAAGYGLGALIDLERILGLDESITTFGLDGLWRFSNNRKHGVRFNYVNYDRSAHTVVSGTVPIFDVEFLGDLESEFGNQVMTITYQYSFTNRDKTEAGFTAGLGFYDYRLALTGRVLVEENPDLTRFGSEKADVIAPVPTVGIFVNHAFRKNLILEFRTSFIDLDIGEHSGRIFDNWAVITWYFTEHLGLGAGLSTSDISYQRSGDGKRLNIAFTQSSVNLSLSYVF